MFWQMVKGALIRQRNRFVESLRSKLTVEDGLKISAAGTWFNHEMTLPTGETLSTGVIEMKSWWKIDGLYPVNDSETLIGQKLAAEKNLHVGDTLKYSGGECEC